MNKNYELLYGYTKGNRHIERQWTKLTLSLEQVTLSLEHTQMVNEIGNTNGNAK